MKDAPSSLVIEAYPKNARTPNPASLSQAADDRDILLGEDKREPARFQLVYTVEMGAGRKTGRKSPGFIDSVLNLIETFYGSVVQMITPWTPKAPKISAPATTAASVDDDEEDDDDADDEQPDGPPRAPADSLAVPPASEVAAGWTLPVARQTPD